VGGVYNSGLLADPRPGAPYDYAAAPPHLVERALAIAAVCADFGVPLRAAALHYPFTHPSVVSALVGAASPEEARDNAALAARPVPASLWAALAARSLLPAGVPVPRA
jgi:D-threo-aldose 1-dehydrogenase